MDKINRLWGRRCSRNLKMELRYWNLITRNSGLIFLVYVLILAGAFYYKKWLDSLPPHFPGALLLALVFTAVAVPSPIRTFTERADLVFLLPAEAELGNYFRKSCLYSYFMQILLLLTLLLIGGPLYFQTTGGSGWDYLIISLAVLVAKAWNLDSHWQQQRIPAMGILTFLRAALSFLFLLSVTNRFSFAASAVTLAVMAFVSAILFHRQAARGMLNWSRLLEMEDRQVMKFLRFANLFTDVPRLRRKVRGRLWLTRLIPTGRWDERAVYSQLYLKTFIRADDYLNQYVRLLLIGCLCIYFFSFGLLTVFLVVSFVYLTGLQLLPLWRHPFPPAIEGLYPIQPSEKKRAFTVLTFVLLCLESLLLSLAGLLAECGFLLSLLFFVSGLFVAILLVFGYTARRLDRTGRK